MSISLDPEGRAEAERARDEAEAALRRARRIVDRSRLLLWSQPMEGRPAPFMPAPDPAPVTILGSVEEAADNEAKASNAERKGSAELSPPLLPGTPA